MATSAHTTARVTLMTEVDATALCRGADAAQGRGHAKQWGFAPGYNDLLGLMVARRCASSLHERAPERQT